MNMIRNSADTENRTADVVADASEVVVHFVADGRVLKKWQTFPC